MTAFRHIPPYTAGVLLLAAACVLPQHDARAAESYDNCTGFIDSVPAVLTTQGTWCLRKDLGTAMASGSAITVAANNITIDCNDFKIGGLAAGEDSLAFGISTPVDLGEGTFVEKQNVVVRNCNIRGFGYGIGLLGSGHLVEDNRLDNNLEGGIFASGEDNNNMVRRNLVFDTGKASSHWVSGIQVDGSAIDNVVSGVVARHYGWGIEMFGDGGNLARGNVVRGLVVANDDADQYASAAGIRSGQGNRVSDNLVHGGAGVTAVRDAGISAGGAGNLAATCDGNSIRGFQTGLEDCLDAGGNIW